ncbi:kinase [Salirhabdus sp. Marseille-P4669]|uniref:kinase n=1 Tax=Salirhabdus sp. Marseille-P4669 TaxID=2042310 RepID=UPI001EFF4A07|nr:kinase [Salirhabdus sp. Marseille-P4669]
MSVNSILDTLLTQYKDRKNHHTFIVGVDGLGGAGKTTFANKLGEELKEKGYHVITIHIDDYIVELNKRYNTGHEEWYEYYSLQWDIQLLQTELFQALSDGDKLINLPLYDKTTDTISTQKRYIKPTSIILIEGIFIQRREWREYFDFVIFIDCPHKERADRVLKRDLYIGDYQNRLTKYQKRYWIAEDKYIEVDDPLKKADVIYSSNDH